MVVRASKQWFDYTLYQACGSQLFMIILKVQGMGMLTSNLLDMMGFVGVKESVSVTIS